MRPIRNPSQSGTMSCPGGMPVPMQKGGTPSPAQKGGTPAAASGKNGPRGRGPSPFGGPPPNETTPCPGGTPVTMEKGGTPAPAQEGGTPASASGKAEEFNRPDRKRPVHMPNIERPNQPVILYVTVCTKDRRPILANSPVHEALIRVWLEAEQYRVGRYVIMPDHIHLFCSPASCDPENVKRWVAYWKRLATIELRNLTPIWQRDCWDTQLRQIGQYGEKWEYVVGNPVRKGLVGAPEQWPFQGCLNELAW